MSDKYVAEFNLHGFRRRIIQYGTPPRTFGLSFPSEVTMHDSIEGNKSLSVYFELLRFDGKVATYSFYNWREMGDKYNGVDASTYFMTSDLTPLKEEATK